MIKKIKILLAVASVIVLGIIGLLFFNRDTDDKVTIHGTIFFIPDELSKGGSCGPYNRPQICTDSKCTDLFVSNRTICLTNYAPLHNQTVTIVGIRKKIDYSKTENCRDGHISVGQFGCGIWEGIEPTEIAIQRVF